jgi:hypothetical protein
MLDFIAASKRGLCSERGRARAKAGGSEDPEE